MTVDDRLREAHARIPEPDAATVARARARLTAELAPRPRRPFAAKLQSYECGAEPIGPAWVQFPVGFYLVALVFLYTIACVFIYGGEFNAELKRVREDRAPEVW